MKDIFNLKDWLLHNCWDSHSCEDCNGNCRFKELINKLIKGDEDGK